ncbi:ARM repeat-containing protein [Exidia glandulosa HHB12029]|uniref:Deoxyhypusine hydroxylase n=1 Tax=Exidia glandulosa HHB12029 TaxID=1314781 RepID=A0A165JY21_EXIGL|nr:ARM repeat-containing protein [Exidia glandulosa HHB12029]
MSTLATPDNLASLRAALLNESQSTPLAQRFRALFTLKAIPGQESIDIISEGFKDESALLKHELAYVLGQKKDPYALDVLTRVLENEREDPMVRHEAAEAMGAISAQSAVPILEKYLNDPERAVRETCEIALDKIKWDHSNQPSASTSTSSATTQFTSVDPAPGSTSGLLKGKATQASVQELRDVLLDASKPLFERYRAMFALRNIGTDEAIDALADGFADDSALFKHEIAFVFGQLSAPHSVPSLLRVLQNSSEDEMVRHEAAEALGGIATPDVLPLLREWATREDAPRVVRESCVVALDMYEYENSTQFQYADGISAAA